MVVWKLPAELTPWLAALTWPLHGRLAWRLAPLLQGVLFARGRRTVASWLRAAGLGADFPAYYYFLAAVGRCTQSVAGSLLRLALGHLGSGDRLLFALDDTPTQRYGPKVQGAGLHHNPTPGPTDQQFLYGHVWVMLAWVVRHPRWGTIGLPLLAWLYVRTKDVPALPRRAGWTFQTKLELAARLVAWLRDWAGYLGKALWVVVDGGYPKAPFLKPALRAGAVLVGRLRKDAALRDLPPPRRADRAAIEQDFHDLKEVEGLGQQQLRNVWANVGAFHLSLWAHTLVELWAWRQPKRALCDRRASPWDDSARRPSHADRRKALQRHCIHQEITQEAQRRPLTRKIQRLFQSLVQLLA